MIGALVFSLGIGYFYSLPYASVLQGGGYRLAVYFRRAKRYIFLSVLHFCLFAAPLVLAEVFLHNALKYFVCFFVFIVTSVLLFFLARSMRVHVTVTDRLVRLLITATLLSAVIVLPTYGTPLTLLCAALPALAPIVLPLAALILSPFERRNNRRYIRAASERLRSVPIRIGITGSYGKTTVKVFLDRLLSAGRDILATPANYNTPLGIAKTVQTMNDGTEVFIAEMGARRSGDISELVEMVRPTEGILTGIAPQHLETFGSIENVMAEKERLSLAIPSGKVYYNLADERVRELFARRDGAKVGVGYKDADAILSDVAITVKGTSFRLRYGDCDISLDIPLLGRAAAEDFALAATVAIDHGIHAEQIQIVAKRLSVVPHRMEVIHQGGLTVLDDSYNIDPVGAAAALETLSMLPAKRRIVYTSGMVELGAETERLNEGYGIRIGEVCDVALVQTSVYGDAVVRGIEKAGRGTNIIRVRDTEEATALFPSVVGAGDVLLVTADLPRDYLL